SKVFEKLIDRLRVRAARCHHDSTDERRSAGARVVAGTPASYPDNAHSSTKHRWRDSGTSGVFRCGAESSSRTGISTRYACASLDALRSVHNLKRAPLDSAQIG